MLLLWEFLYQYKLCDWLHVQSIVFKLLILTKFVRDLNFYAQLNASCRATKWGKITWYFARMKILASFMYLTHKWSKYSSGWNIMFAESLPIQDSVDIFTANLDQSLVSGFWKIFTQYFTLKNLVMETYIWSIKIILSSACHIWALVFIPLDIVSYIK